MSSIVRRLSFLFPPNVAASGQPSCVTIATPQEMEVFGHRLAKALGPKPGDFIMLQGPVGVGKSVLARGFIRKALANEGLKVQSPTFLLEQEYEHPSKQFLIRHFDLYRFEPQMTEIDARALDWSNALRNDVCLVEWPERIKLKMLLPDEWLSIKLDFASGIISGQDNLVAARTIEVVPTMKRDILG